MFLLLFMFFFISRNIFKVVIIYWKSRSYSVLSNFIVVTNMGFHSARKTAWILMVLLPLAFIVHVDGKHKKVVTTTLSATTETEKIQETTASPNISTQEKDGNSTLDYGMIYYEYPQGLFLNDTSYNNTYGPGTYYNNYYGDYYAYYIYPEFESYFDPMDDNSTTNEITTLMTTKKHGNGTKKSKVKSLRRKRRSLPSKQLTKHLCLKNLLNVTNIFKFVRYIYECREEEFKQFACINSNGFIKPCYKLKERGMPEIDICVKKEFVPYVSTCDSLEPQSFCFPDAKETNRIVICNDHKHRICFNGGLINCNHQGKIQVTPPPIKPSKHTKQVKKRKPRAVISPQKPGKLKNPRVNCSNCEVEVKLVVDEMADNVQQALIKVRPLDTSINMEDDSDFSDF